MLSPVLFSGYWQFRVDLKNFKVMLIKKMDDSLKLRNNVLYLQNIEWFILHFSLILPVLQYHSFFGDFLGIQSH